MARDFIPEGEGAANDAAYGQGGFNDFVPESEDGEEPEEEQSSVVLAPSTMKLLASAGVSVDDVSSMSDDDLLAIDGLGPKTLESIREAHPAE